MSMCEGTVAVLIDIFQKDTARSGAVEAISIRSPDAMVRGERNEADPGPQTENQQPKRCRRC